MSTTPLDSPQKRALAGIAGLTLTVILSWAAWLAALFLPNPELLGLFVGVLFILLIVSGNVAAAHVFARANWRLQMIPATGHVYVSRRMFCIAVSAWVLVVILSVGIGLYVYATPGKSRTVDGLVNFISLIAFGALIAVFLAAFRLIEPVRSSV